MAMIPVEVQLPNKPQTARVVGEAPDDMSKEEVARLVGIPQDCFIYDAKIMGGKKRPRRWSFVADVKFVERKSGMTTCPHCGEKF